MKFNITLSDTEITSLVNFIEYWNDVQQADQDLLDNIAKKLDNTIIKHRERLSRHKVKDQRRSGNENIRYFFIH